MIDGPHSPLRMRRTVAIAAAALVLSVPAAAIAAGDEAPCNRPPITPLRWDEDYSFLRDPQCRTEFWDPLKYLALNHKLPAYLTIGIDVRERFEYLNTSDWRRASGSTGFLLQHVMPYADVHVGPHFQGFLQLTSNLVWGRDPEPLDRDDLDLLQAFGSLSFGWFTLRGGRQEIQYASSRLVSIRDGLNVRLAFDGLRVIDRIGGDWQVDGFGLVPEQVRAGIFDDRPESGQWFGGVYASGPVFADRFGLDLYYLGRFRDNWVAFATTRCSSKERRASCAIQLGHASGGRPSDSTTTLSSRFRQGRSARVRLPRGWWRRTSATPSTCFRPGPVSACK